jgi:hypothetical protein
MDLTEIVQTFLNPNPRIVQTISMSWTFAEIVQSFPNP